MGISPYQHIRAEHSFEKLHSINYVCHPVWWALKIFTDHYPCSRQSASLPINLCILGGKLPNIPHVQLKEQNKTPQQNTNLSSNQIHQCTLPSTLNKSVINQTPYFHMLYSLSPQLCSFCSESSTYRTFKLSRGLWKCFPLWLIKVCSSVGYIYKYLPLFFKNIFMSLLFTFNHQSMCLQWVHFFKKDSSSFFSLSTPDFILILYNGSIINCQYSVFGI